ncbi:MAG TPA: family 43 glycosylhydrolase [Chthoniobacteraceae bacterium]|jgi:hypothetical protein|nr:family 43 glycosylhydrolase [Chthoniobacteraceae bacterium]
MPSSRYSRLLVSLFSLALIASTAAAAPATFCNPLDIPYRFRLKTPSAREAADPTVIVFHGEYWLFASKSGGYWHTRDFVNWKFVEPTGLPLENYAPTVEAVGGKLYFVAGSSAIYTTGDPVRGIWTKVADIPDDPDPDLFLDTDGRLYLYGGCSDSKPIWVEELNPRTFKVIGSRTNLIAAKPAMHGWEVRRPYWIKGDPETDAHNHHTAAYIEGAWMNKVNGKYYLQYACPGTELPNYGDGVYVGDHPTGPFTYMPANPFSYHPTGFAVGAGHGSTFKDSLGNYWHIATAAISKRDIFERRLVLYPARFFPDGQVAADTYLGDYPQYVPGTKSGAFGANSAGWMLVSLRRPATASSELDGYPASGAVDENIQTWWSAKTGNPGEWLQVDLRDNCTINAIQINFADQGSTTLGRLHDAYQYRVEASDDGKTWNTIIDRSKNERDAPHDYEPLDSPVKARYVRLINVHTPAGMLFSVSGLRIFGKGAGSAPDRVSHIMVIRDKQDPRNAHISWSPSAEAEFYIVRYGIRPDRLFSNYQIYNGSALDLHALNSDTPDYYVTVDAINAAGVTLGPAAVEMK